MKIENITSKVEIESRAVRLLRDCVNPLVQDLIFLKEKSCLDHDRSASISPTSINITRMNLAVVNFQDIVTKDSPYQSSYTHMAKPKTIRSDGDSQRKANSAIYANYYSNHSSQQQTCALGPGSNKALQAPKNKKRKDQSTLSRSWPMEFTRSPDSGSSKERPKISKKFARTRIDQFFAKKQN